MAISNLNGLFVHLLKDIYYAEKQIVKALPDMISKADSSELSDLLSAHKDETHNQITRLEKVFDSIGEDAKGEKCPAIEGILKETRELMDEIDDADTLDAAMIAAAQAVEHYEITRYGTLITWAAELSLDKEVTNLLRDTLSEEDSADEKLTALAEERLNEKANS